MTASSGKKDSYWRFDRTWRLCRHLLITIHLACGGLTIILFPSDRRKLSMLAESFLVIDVPHIISVQSLQDGDLKLNWDTASSPKGSTQKDIGLAG